MLGVGVHLVIVRQYDHDILIITITHTVSRRQHMGGVKQRSGAEEMGHSVYFRC